MGCRHNGYIIFNRYGTPLIFLPIIIFPLSKLNYLIVAQSYSLDLSTISLFLGIYEFQKSMTFLECMSSICEVVSI